MSELARELVDLPHFRWLPGMLLQGGGGMRVINVGPERIVVRGWLGIVQTHDWSSGRVITLTAGQPNVWTDGPLLPELEDPKGTTQALVATLKASP